MKTNYNFSVLKSPVAKIVISLLDELKVDLHALGDKIVIKKYVIRIFV